MQPPEYKREYNFTKDNGNNTKHEEINVELDKIAVSINRIRENLAWIQRDDMYLHDRIVDQIIDRIGDGVATLAKEAKEKWLEILECLLKTEMTLEEAKKILADILAYGPVQSDWDEAKTTALAYIKNKPTKVSQFQNDANYISNSTLLTALQAIAKQVQSDWKVDDTSNLAYIKNKPAFSAVAYSGKYGDLTELPNLSKVATSGSYNDLDNKPTKLSDFTNDIGAGGGGVELINGYFSATDGSDMSVNISEADASRLMGAQMIGLVSNSITEYFYRTSAISGRVIFASPNSTSYSRLEQNDGGHASKTYIANRLVSIGGTSMTYSLPTVASFWS